MCMRCKVGLLGPKEFRKLFNSKLSLSLELNATPEEISHGRQEKELSTEYYNTQEYQNIF